MAGMGDNPLVGEYTKGISKGGDYFAKLDQRCKREKFDARILVPDLEMGLMKDLKSIQARSIAATGLGRFACLEATKDVPIASKVSSEPLCKRTVRVDSFASLKDAMAQRAVSL